MLKTASPERKRQTQAKPVPPKEPERRFKCSNDLCEFSIKGFEKENELQTHVATAHLRIDDPLQFLLDNAAEALGVDTDGNAKDVKPVAAARTKSVAGANKAQLPPVKKEMLKVEGRSPGKIKAEALTPMPMTGAPTPASHGAASKKIGATPAKPAPVQIRDSTADQKPKTMRENLMDKAGMTVVSKDSADQTIKSEDEAATETLFADEAAFSFLTGLDGALGNDIFDMNWDEGLDLTAGMPTPTTPPLTPSEGSNTVGTDSSTSSLENIHENDLLRHAFGWTEGGPDDLEKMASERIGLDIVNAGKDKSEWERPQLTLENIWGEDSDGMNFLNDWVVDG